MHDSEVQLHTLRYFLYIIDVTACGHKEGQMQCNKHRMLLRRLVVVKLTEAIAFKITQDDASI